MTDQTSTPPAPRGACPTLDDPMAVADGLLARFRPQQGLNAAQVAALAHAAQSCGNGLIEITARGNVQVRGLREDTSAAFRTALEAAGIAVRRGVSIEYSPIAGEDPSEIADPRPLVAALETECARALAQGPLSPKLSIVVASGGQILLNQLKADIRLLARGAQSWTLDVGGESIGEIAEADTPRAVSVILAMLQELGPRARGTDLERAQVESALPRIDIQPITPANTVPLMAGPLSLSGDTQGMRIALRYGQVKSQMLEALSRVMRDYGVAEARPAPDRTIVLTGIPAGALPDLSLAVAGHGFLVRPEVPNAMLTLCSGAEAGSEGVIQAADLAAAIASGAPDLIDGSFHIHVSTCAKGCAHMGRPGLVLEGNEIFLHGDKQKMPLARLQPEAMEMSVMHLAQRIHAERQDGETTLDCLNRLGAQ